MCVVGVEQFAAVWVCMLVAVVTSHKLIDKHVIPVSLVIKSVCCVWRQDAGEASVANIDKLRHANGKVSPAELRLKMQKVMTQCCMTEDSYLLDLASGPSVTLPLQLDTTASGPSVTLPYHLTQLLFNCVIVVSVPHMSLSLCLV